MASKKNLSNKSLALIIGTSVAVILLAAVAIYLVLPHGETGGGEALGADGVCPDGLFCGECGDAVRHGRPAGR